MFLTLTALWSPSGVFHLFGPEPLFCPDRSPMAHGRLPCVCTGLWLQASCHGSNVFPHSPHPLTTQPCKDRAAQWGVFPWGIISSSSFLLFVTCPFKQDSPKVQWRILQERLLLLPSDSVSCSAQTSHPSFLSAFLPVTFLKRRGEVRV